jgi:hypothetical protein
MLKGDPWEIGELEPTPVKWKKKMEVRHALPYSSTAQSLSAALEGLLSPADAPWLVFIPGMMCGNRPILDVYVEGIRQLYEEPLQLGGTLWIIWGGDSALYAVNKQRVAETPPLVQKMAHALHGLPQTQLHLFADSMGTHIASQLVMAMPPREPHRFVSCTLAVSDLPSDHFAKAEHREAFVRQCGRTHILQRDADLVLKASGALNQAPRLGTQIAQRELLPESFVVSDFSDITDLPLPTRISGHSYFRESVQAAKRIGRGIVGA